jgi:uncharacterized damage-inducible protein DinB
VNDGLVDAFRHNAWATRKLLQFCERLSPEQLRAKAIGAFGSINATLKHILGSEAYYRFLFTGRLPDWDWKDDELPSIKQLERWADDMASFWEDLLSSPVDADVLLIREHDDGSKREARIGIVLAQVLHHGNVHREQVCSILTSLGIEPPDLDVWSFGIATGRHRLQGRG